MKDVIMQNQDWINETWDKIDLKLKKVALRSRNKLPYTMIDGVHDDKSESAPCWWTNGFWGGMMWLMYLGTGNEEYRKTAEQSEILLDKALKQYKMLEHDVGFMWHLTSGANYRITGKEESCVRNLYAASLLCSRYNISGDYIRAWNGADVMGYSIIDCLMNLSLLYWASKELGDDRFKRIAMCHMDMAVRDHIRPDGSINHIVDHEVDKVGVKGIVLGQGYSETSCWSRGLAWAVYGSIISYIHAGKTEYLEAAKKTADYFIEHCSKTGYRPVIDFCAPKEPIYYDSTSGVCAACGMLEIAKYVSEEEGKKYILAAICILKACDESFCNYDTEQDALVMMGSEYYPHTEERMRAVHMPIIYGDYFFVEAIFKLKGNDFFMW